MPPWTHLHPIVIHFPIALLLVVPPIVVLGLLWPTQRKGIHSTALALLLLGTAMALLSLATGLAAAGWVPRNPALLEVLDDHEDQAKLTVLLFGLLSLGFFLLHLLPPRLTRPPRPGWMLGMHLLWLALSLAASLSLLRTGHLGGRLVHQLGVHDTTLK